MLTILPALPLLLLVPAAWSLRGRGRAVLGGVTTIDDAVAACRRSGLSGWELVAFAQQLAYRKFTHYSCRNLWDTPASAFRRGMGYCTQYNLALQCVLRQLGLEVWAVYSLRIAVADDPTWTMGHTWLRVRIAGEERDVCAGHAANLLAPGHGAPLSGALLAREFQAFADQIAGRAADERTSA